MRYVRVSVPCVVPAAAPPGVILPVKRHRGEPGHTRAHGHNRYRSVQKHRDMRGEPGLTRYQHCSYRGERYPDHARACASRARVRGWRVRPRDVRLILDSTGHALYWLLGGEPNGKTEGEAKADFMRWSSGAPCNNMATCDVQRASERRGAREVGGQMLSRNAAQTIDVLGFCRSAICRSS